MMNISLTPQLEDYLKKKVAAGNYHSVSEVVREGLRALQEVEEEKERQRRLDLLLEKRLAEVEAGEVGIPIDEAMDRVESRIRKFCG